jgi:ADP-ribose pyrophosphatase YjhB (NUDIX family)
MADSTCTDGPPAPVPAPGAPRVGVGAVVWRGDQVLLVRRGKEPGYGQWSLPGGSQELGETLFDAAAREVREGTGVEIRPLGILTAVDNIVRGPAGGILFHYTIIDVTADWVSGEPTAADDVLDARWASRSDCQALVEWPVLRRVLDEAWTARTTKD